MTELVLSDPLQREFEQLEETIEYREITAGFAKILYRSLNTVSQHRSEVQLSLLRTALLEFRQSLQVEAYYLIVPGPFSALIRCIEERDDWQVESEWKDWLNALIRQVQKMIKGEYEFD